MLTIVHAADLHLETTFPGGIAGTRRRASLADAFVRVVDLALARNADVLTIGGDLFETQRAGPQTARLIYDEFARFGRTVLIAPGNHDPYCARSPYVRADKPPNVHVFAEPSWVPFPVAQAIAIYGFGHTPAEPGRPFAGARFDRPGMCIALIHGSDEDRCPTGKRATAPFNGAEIRAAGAAFALCGHYHAGYVIRDALGPVFGYPGSPEPIRFGERGEHGALVVTVDAMGVNVEAVPLARTQLIENTVRLDEASCENAVLRALEIAFDGFGEHDHLRVKLTGTVAVGTHLDFNLLTDHFARRLGGIEFIDATQHADYADLAQERTVRGRALDDLLARSKSGDDHARRAIPLIVAAFAGDEIVP